MHAKQIEIYKSMTPEQKLNAALSLYYSARDLKIAGLKKQHPDMPEEEILQKVKEIFLYART